MQKKEAEAAFQHAKLLEEHRDWDDAVTAYSALENVDILKLRVARRRAECLMRLQRWEEARSDVEYVFASGDKIGNRDVQRHSSVAMHFGETEKAHRIIADFARQRRDKLPDSPFLILTAAAPKTASTSMAVALAAALGFEWCDYLAAPLSGSHYGVPSWEAIDCLKGKGVVNHCHLFPSADTLDALALRPHVRVAVHHRNPVETIVSFADAILRGHAPNIMSRQDIRPDASTKAVVEWVLRVYLPKYVTWTEAWFKASQQGHPSILGVTTRDEMLQADQDQVARRLLLQYGIEPIKAETVSRRTGLRLKGDQAVQLSKVQEAKILGSFPDEFLNQFGWLRDE